MVRGATQKFSIKLPKSETAGYPVAALDSYCVCFGRGHKVYSEVSGKFSDAEVVTDDTGTTFFVQLTEEQSLALRPGECLVQVKIKWETGYVLVSKTATIEVEDSICNKELADHE